MTREEIINKIVKLWNEKKTSGEIAKEMNLTRNAVMGVVHRHGKRKTPLKIIRRVEYKPKAEKPKIEKPKNEKKLEEKLTIFKKQIKVTEPFAEMKFKKTKGKKMLELGPFDCRWIWDDKSYCGKPTAMCSYCAEHKAIVYTPVRKKESA